jgi:hypothetical protein
MTERACPKTEKPSEHAATTAVPSLKSGLGKWRRNRIDTLACLSYRVRASGQCSHAERPAPQRFEDVRRTKSQFIR